MNYVWSVFQKRLNTFPIAFKEEGDCRLPLNTSQMRQPNPHISADLKIVLHNDYNIFIGHHINKNTI